MQKIHPVLLAGGSGNRLWPLSRKSYPKQFLKLLDEKTLFQKSAERLTSSDIIQLADPIILTHSDFRFIVTEQLQEVGVDPRQILIEPEGKNTAAAILAASLFAASHDEEAILLVAPSDHLIPNTRDFHCAISVGLSQVEKNKIVTFGIEPTHPETGYGYLELSPCNCESLGISDVKKFVEKPDLAIAEQMLETGNFLWNAGIFLFDAKKMIESFRLYAPQTFDLVSSAFEKAVLDLGFLRLSQPPWSQLQNISIDYAIMQKAQNLVAVRYSSKWSDLGGWDAVWSESDKDASGNAISDGANVIDCKESLLRSETDGQEIVGLGLEDIIAIAMPDAVLVAHKSRAQDVKVAVDLLRENKIPQAESFPKDHRPWGWFESLMLSDCFQVKRICVNPGAALSLQSHQFRSEHWIVVSGSVKVTVDEVRTTIPEGGSIFVPQSAVHRMENETETPAIVIEVQVGSYFGEDDIIRHGDKYNRD